MSSPQPRSNKSNSKSNSKSNNKSNKPLHETDDVSDIDSKEEEAKRELQLRRREVWLHDVTDFMKARILMNQKWINVSEGKLETYDRWDHLSTLNTVSIAQPATSIGDLYMMAEKVKPQFDTMFKELCDFLSINREADKILSKGLVEAFPALKMAPINSRYSNDHNSSHVDWGWEWLPLDLESINYPFAIMMPLKEKPRVLQKAKENYADSKFPMVKMMDIIRASIVCISDDHVRWTVNHIIARFLVLRVDNRFQNVVCGNGYRDVIVRVGLPIPEQENSRLATSGQSLVASPMFICEIQVHLLSLYVLSEQSTMNLWSNYIKFRIFFGNSEKYKAVVDRLKVMKKMDQVGDDYDCLEDLMQVYLQKTGRVSRDIVRIGMFVDLFMKVREDSLAEELQLSVIRQLRNMGNRQLDLSIALGKLANYFVLIKKYEEAEPLSREALDICIAIHGGNHKETCIRYIQLGRLFYCQKKYFEGLPFFLNALRGLKVLEGTDATAEIIKLYFIIGELYSDMNNIKEARLIYLRIIEVTKIVYETDKHSDIAEMFSRLAFFDEIDRDYNEALRKYSISLEQNLFCFGEASEQVANNYNALGYVYYSLNYLAKALNFFEVENRIRSRLPISKKRGECLNLLGHLYLELHLFDKAEPFLRQGHDTFLEMHSSAKCYDRDILTEQFYIGFACSKNDLGEILLRKGPKYFDEVKDLLNQAYSWRYKYLSLDNTATKKTLLQQDILYEMIKGEQNRLETIRKHKEFILKQQGDPKDRPQTGISSRPQTSGPDINRSVGGDAISESNAQVLVVNRSGSDGTNGHLGGEEDDERDHIMLPEDMRAMKPIDGVLNSINTILVDAEELRDAGDWSMALFKYRRIFETFYFYKKSKLNGTDAKFNVDKPNPNVITNHSICSIYDEKERTWTFPYTPPVQSEYDYEYQVAIKPKTDADIEEEIKKVEKEKEEEKERHRQMAKRGTKSQEKEVAKKASKHERPKDLHVEIIKYNIERDVAACIAFMSYATYLEDVENFQEGARVLTAVLKNLYDVYGTSIPHNLIAQSHLNLGGVFLRMGKFDLALENLEKSRNAYLLLNHEAESAEYSTLYHNLGMCLHSIGDFVGADRYLNLSLDLRLKLYGEDDVSYRACLNSIALLHISQGSYEASYKALQSLLQYKLESVGNTHPSYSVTLNNFAAVHYLFSDLAKAGKMFTESLEFREKSLRKSTKLVDFGVQNLVKVFEVQNDKKNVAPFNYGRSVIQKYMDLHPHLDK